MSDQTENGARDSKKQSRKRHYPEEACDRQRVERERKKIEESKERQRVLRCQSAL